MLPAPRETHVNLDKFVKKLQNEVKRNPAQAGVLALLTLALSNSGETVQLLHEVQVVNVP